jgi:hypothetical protein
MDRSILAAVTGTCMILSASAVSAQTTRNARFTSVDDWRTQVEILLAEHDAQARSLGLERRFQPFYDQLRDGHYKTIDFDLQAGTHYYFVGVCDVDCADLDLRLIDDQGNERDADTRPDDTPVVQVTPRYSARFHLRVIMADCGADPCWWGVGAYSD